jgi:hypothetical protein
MNKIRNLNKAARVGGIDPARQHIDNQSIAMVFLIIDGSA